MPVPAEVRAVPRPKNTIVQDTGRKGLLRYPVRERASGKYVRDTNPQPRNGKVIGHIIGDAFVPVVDRAEDKADFLSYGSSALIKSVSGDLYSDLMKVYPPNDAATIMAVASLKVIRPGVTAMRMRTHYNRTFISVYYPFAALSPNSLTSLFQRLGKNGAARKKFFECRLLATAAEHHIAIDGMLKQDNSTVNDLSAFSYKARVRGCRDISLLYAYDIELREPICAQVFPGNRIDASNYADFIRDNDIRRGLIIDDKGFPPSQIKKELEERPDLHFLTPIKRNDKRIANNDMLDFTGVLSLNDAQVLYKKHEIKGGRYLYAFMNEKKAASEQHAFLSRAQKDGFDADKYKNKSKLFGVVVFESDVDLEPLTAYLAYQERWLLEMVFKYYKSAEDLDHTGVQGDFSVIGNEFVNFISTVITCRIINKATKVKLLTKMTYSDLIDDLSTSWRRTDAPLDQMPRTDDEYWVHTLKYVFAQLEALGLSEPVTKTKSANPKKNSAGKRRKKK